MKFDRFQKAYDDAILYIQKSLEPDNFEPHMHKLVQWMLETDANPYGYLPHSFAGMVETAEGFMLLIRHIHHAVYDDGEITFVKVNDQPRIVFARSDDPDFRQNVLTETEQHMENIENRKFRVKYKITVLDIEPNEFPDLYDAYETAFLKKAFARDVAINDIEFAVEQYSKYKCFSNTWVDEMSDEIMRWNKFYDGMNK